MGYDVYMKWKGQTKAEREAQFTGFSTVHGHAGYLRESYAGSVHAIHVLITEDAASSDDGVPVRASDLRDRLAATLEAVATRYKGADREKLLRVKKSYSDFVELAERKEAETGEPVIIAIH